MNQTETMSAEEVADYLKASVRTVQELALDGKLKGAKVGKGWVFFRRDVVAYLEGRIYGGAAIVMRDGFSCAARVGGTTDACAIKWFSELMPGEEANHE